MKKKLFFILTFILITSLNCILVFAQNNFSSDTEYIYFSDGSYTISVITAEPVYSKKSNNVTKSKTVTHYSSSNVKLWYVKVTGTFTYDTKTSKCINSEVSASSYNNSWKITSKSASKSGSTAIASATAKQYQGVSVVQTKQETVKLTCDKNGKFS